MLQDFYTVAQYPSPEQRRIWVLKMTEVRCQEHTDDKSPEAFAEAFEGYV